MSTVFMLCNLMIYNCSCIFTGLYIIDCTIWKGTEMIDIHKNQRYSANNVFSFRGKVGQEEINSIMLQMNSIIEGANAKITGPAITVMHSIENNAGCQVCNFEVMIPLNESVNSTDRFIFKEEFLLENALMFRHTGNPQRINAEMQEFVKYIKDNNFKPVTPFYNITVKAAKSTVDIDSMIIDIYVGVE